MNNVEITELQEIINASEMVLVSHGTKQIIAKALGGLEVRENGVVVWRGMQPYQAMTAYNKIGESEVENV